MEEREKTQKEKIIDLLTKEARECRQQADVYERMGETHYGLLRLDASTIERMIKKIKHEII